MKKLIVMMMLLTGIKENLFAQSTQSDKAFNLAENIIINRRFMIDLGHGNKVKLELTDLADLSNAANVDSILQVYLSDAASLKDSMSNPLTSKRIDYIVDEQDRKKIRFLQFQPKGSSFLLNNGEVSALRTEQDTVHIIGFIANPSKPVDQVSISNKRCFHYTFYVNNINDLSSMVNGSLKEKIKIIQNDLNDKWPIVLGSGSHYLKKDKTITADRPRGNTAGGEGDYVALMASVNVQNYKQYFVPSFSLGARVTIANRYRTFKWEPGLFWEPHFLFAKDSSNKLRTYRNDFLTLTYGQGGIKDYDSRKEFSFSAVMSFGYLIKREGNFFEKNTFRFGAGKFQWQKTTIEPSLYFNDFFKGVTPSIRITQHF
jgi:hypothetical protein